MWKIETYQRDDGKWDWRLFAANGEQLCESLQGYENRNVCVGMALRVVVLAHRSLDEYVDAEHDVIHVDEGQ